MKNNQSGFSVIEGLLIFVIIGIVGFTGWFIWHSKQSTDKTLDKGNQSTFVGTAKKSVASNDTAKTTNDNQNIIKFAEIGIQITVPDSIKDLTYTTEKQTDQTGKPVTYIRLSTKTLTAKDADCDSTGSALGVIGRGQGSYIDANTEANIGYYGMLQKQFDSFFIDYESSHAACSGDTTIEQLRLAQTEALRSSLTTIKQIP